MHVLTGADVDGKQVESARLLAAIMTAQVVKTNGWTELCIHMDIIYISNMYIYTVQWRERQRERSSRAHTIFSLLGAFPLFFYPAAHKFISQVTIKGASFFISELLSHDLRIIAVML